MRMRDGRGSGGEETDQVNIATCTLYDRGGLAHLTAKEWRCCDWGEMAGDPPGT